jgi:magnesium transporter
MPQLNRMRKNLRIHRVKRIKRPPPGSAPGVINVPDDALKMNLRTFVYDQEFMRESELHTLDEIKDQLKSFPDKVHWFDIKGFGNKAFLEQLADFFEIHRLQLEDVVNVYQRPKVEEYKGQLFFISRVLSENSNSFQNDQLSIFLGKNFVITIQDKYEDVLDPVRNRIRLGKGYLRRSGADYLVYSLMDVVIDNYYPILERMGDYLDDLQDELISNPTRESMNRLLQRKKDLVLLRRTIWTERDKMNDILRSSFTEINDTTKVFFRDSYDHCIQLLDLVESYKEVTASLMDVYQSSVSNRLNQVMKVLTIISTIFIPLTFIVGLYGMNFSRHDPVSGAQLPLNMPELYSPYGYVTVCVMMIVIVIVQIIYFYKKGWLNKA